MSKKIKKTIGAQAEIIISLNATLNDLETRLQACEQMQTTLQAQFQAIKRKNKRKGINYEGGGRFEVR